MKCSCSKLITTKTFICGSIWTQVKIVLSLETRYHVASWVMNFVSFDVKICESHVKCKTRFCHIAMTATFDVIQLNVSEFWPELFHEGKNH